MWDDLGFNAQPVANFEWEKDHPEAPDFVSEIVIQASRGGGSEVTIGLEYYQASTHDQFADAAEMHDYADSVEAQAYAFADAHISGDPTSAVYKQTHEALVSLYARATIGALGGGQSTFVGPNGHTLSYSELLTGLQNTQVIIGPFHAYDGKDYNAFTDVRTAQSQIYIDPAKLGDYTGLFGEQMGLNMVIYHELAHALPDGRADAFNINREAIANEYGQMLSELGNALYPNDVELAELGGTVPR